MNKVRVQLGAVLLFMIISPLLSVQLLSCTHTIYVSGPPAYDNQYWYKQSKILYNALKLEVHRQGNEIELFPKRYYRENISRDTPDLKNTSVRKCLNKQGIETLYENTDKLLDDLVMLILRRRGESSDKIHLVAHGRGGELLLSLKRGEYSGIIGSCIVFDGDNDLYTSATDSENSEDSKNVIDLALRSNGDLVLNFNLPDSLSSKNGHKGEIVAMVTAVAGVVGAILALL